MMNAEQLQALIDAAIEMSANGFPVMKAEIALMNYILKTEPA